MEVYNLSSYYGESVDVNALGAVVFRQHGTDFHGSLFHDFNQIILVIHQTDYPKPRIDHGIMGETRYKIWNVGYNPLQRSLINGDQPDLLQCLLEGEIIFDTHEQVSQLRQQLLAFGQPLKEQRKFVEFARFLRLYTNSKRYLDSSMVMDAYQSVLGSLQHWARIELIESGILPRDEIWEQLKGIKSTVHKLYSELTMSVETLKQRVELVVLACEFFVLSKMADCSVLLLRILASRKEPWSIEELAQHPQLESVEPEISIVLRKLVYRSLVNEVTHWDGEHNRYGIRYNTELTAL